MSTKSQRVWDARRRNARKLAEMGDGDEDKALDLILRTIRYALADVREFERNTSEAYYKSARSSHKAKLLERRRARLESEWAAYELILVNYGLYPTVTTHKGGGDVIDLDYFD